MSTRNAFPVGLYATLLLALCWLLLPELLRPVERTLLGVACLPHRAWSVLMGTPALASDRVERQRMRLFELEQGLRVRSASHDVERGRDRMHSALDPVACAVLSAERRGGGGMPCELRLDRSYRDLAGCADVVTCGDALLGFLAQPGIGAAIADTPMDPARVLLLNHPESRTVAVSLALPEGGTLRCIAAPSSTVDPAPIRTTLHDDPYRAAKLGQSGIDVRTESLDHAWIGAMPSGLLVGRTRVWGYEIGGEALTIGLYIEPAVDFRALPQVVLWQSVPGSVPPRLLPERIAAVASPLPDQSGGRWLVQGSTDLPDGAAVVQEGVCLGTLRSVAFAQGLCTPFAASRHAWSLWLLPDAADSAPFGIYGEVIYAAGSTAWFRPRGAFDPMPVGSGGAFVFTGSNGTDCPPGLLLGRAEPDLQRQLWRITVPSLSGAQHVEVLSTRLAAEARR
ncbi:MAG: hypothetical protein RLZZ562_2294 [Planctomycetota bacterium]|jgi:hypothetical protein